MARIKAGELRFLVATDVAARGIDISDLSHVIGYASPESAEVYVHRTGRTGRAGKAGVAISLVSGLDIGNFRQPPEDQPHRDRGAARSRRTTEIVARIRERLQVKVEQEIRHLPTREREWQVDRLVPAWSKTLAASDEGQRELAAIAAAYLREHRPETTVNDDAAGATRDEASERAPERRDGFGGGRGGGGGGGRSGGGGGGRSGGGGRGRGARRGRRGGGGGRR